jgi:hypothetical protein
MAVFMAVKTILYHWHPAMPNARKVRVKIFAIELQMLGSHRDKGII